MTPATRLKLSIAKRAAWAATVRPEDTLAALRGHATTVEAARYLGITPKALQARVRRLAAVGMLPEDIAERRRPHAGIPQPRRPKPKPTAAMQPVVIPRWVPPVPAAPEPRREPVRVTVLPTPDWPAPAAPAPADAFAAARQRNARRRAAEVWVERHPDDLVGVR